MSAITMISLSSVAKKLGLTKDAIKRAIQLEPLSSHLRQHTETIDHRGLFIDTEGIKLIAKSLSIEIPPVSPKSRFDMLNLLLSEIEIGVVPRVFQAYNDNYRFFIARTVENDFVYGYPIDLQKYYNEIDFPFKFPPAKAIIRKQKLGLYFRRYNCLFLMKDEACSDISKIAVETRILQIENEYANCPASEKNIIDKKIENLKKYIESVIKTNS